MSQDTEYTNQRSILYWFQKCIASYRYFEYLASYGILEVKFVLVCAKVTNWPSRFQNSRNIQNNDIKLNIFGINIKFDFLRLPYHPMTMFKIF